MSSSIWCASANYDDSESQSLFCGIFKQDPRIIGARLARPSNPSFLNPKYHETYENKKYGYQSDECQYHSDPNVFQTTQVSTYPHCSLFD